jgi:hypothetical protein
MCEERLGYKRSGDDIVAMYALNAAYKLNKLEGDSSDIATERVEERLEYVRKLIEYNERLSQNEDSYYDVYFSFLDKYDYEYIKEDIYKISIRYKDIKFYYIEADYYRYLIFMKYLLDHNLQLTKSRFQRIFSRNLDRFTQKLQGELK